MTAGISLKFIRKVDKTCWENKYETLFDAECVWLIAKRFHQFLSQEFGFFFFLGVEGGGRDSSDTVSSSIQILRFLRTNFAEIEAYIATFGIKSNFV